MFQSMKKLVDYYIRNYEPTMKHGEEGVKQCGYKAYVGGDYEQGSNQQLDYCMNRKFYGRKRCAEPRSRV
ncbi:hypothetical protein H6F96_28740 [Microcoleus sp. FACHB-53]|nr:hypothetical protein [Microcoleus sp. FACHB-53]